MRRVPCLLLVFLLPTVAGAGGLKAVDIQDPSLSATGAATALGETLLLDGVPLLEGSVSTLELRRFQIFAHDARLIVHGEDGVRELPPPDNAYFHGRIAGDPASWAALTVREAGGTRGFVAKAGRYWILSSEGDGGSLATAEIDAATAFADKTAAFSCGASDLETPEAAIDHLFGSATQPLEAKPERIAGGTPSYTARVAIETDFELYNRFGSTTDAADYIADLFAYGSTLYSAEVDTSFVLGDMFFYTTSSDPWGQTSTGCGLMEFGKYWNDNRGGVERTIAHFVSGKSSLSGIAWVGVLCSGGFTTSLSGNGLSCPGMTDTSNYGGGYGFTSGISGSFDIGSPTALWDIVAVTHEVGHNFDSPHTHCYGGIGGITDPVDECYSGQCGQTGCHCGGTSLPQPCAGGAGSGCGTIMSYCHLRAGGMGNITLTLGEGHPHGVDPGRVPDRMNDHVVSRAITNPGCLDYVPERTPIFDDGFDTGTTLAWDSTVN